MTALEAIQAVEARGGWVSLNGDKIRCKVPENATGLVEALRAKRAVVVEILRQRAGALAGWISNHCVGYGRASSNPSILYREYLRSAHGVTLTYKQFLQAFEARGWPLDPNGMLAGVCLADDFLRPVELEANTAGVAVQ